MAKHEQGLTETDSLKRDPNTPLKSGRRSKSPRFVPAEFFPEIRQEPANDTVPRVILQPHLARSPRIEHTVAEIKKYFITTDALQNYLRAFKTAVHEAERGDRSFGGIELPTGELLNDVGISSAEQARMLLAQLQEAANTEMRTDKARTSINANAMEAARAQLKELKAREAEISADLYLAEHNRPLSSKLRSFLGMNADESSTTLENLRQQLREVTAHIHSLSEDLHFRTLSNAHGGRFVEPINEEPIDSRAYIRSFGQEIHRSARDAAHLAMPLIPSSEETEEEQRHAAKRIEEQELRSERETAQLRAFEESIRANPRLAVESGALPNAAELYDTLTLTCDPENAKEIVLTIALYRYAKNVRALYASTYLDRLQTLTARTVLSESTNRQIQAAAGLNEPKKPAARRRAKTTTASVDSKFFSKF